MLKSFGVIVVQILQCRDDGALSRLCINGCFTSGYFKNVVQNCPEFCHAKVKLQYYRIFINKYL